MESKSEMMPTFESVFVKQEAVHSELNQITHSKGGVDQIYENDLNPYTNIYFNSNEKDKTQIEDKSFHCKLCNKTFSYQVTLKSHMLKNHHIEYSDEEDKKVQCSHCLKIIGNNNLKRHMRTHAINMCEVCGETFTCKNKLKVHTREHTGEEEDKPFYCKLCEKTFSFHSTLKKHMSKSHQLNSTGEKDIKIQCSHCLIFIGKENFKRHLRTHQLMNHNNGDEKYEMHQCDYCPKSFSCKSQLTIHVRGHIGEKPHQCDVCGMTFAAKSYLTKHLRTHTDEKNFKCNHCDLSFKIVYNLKIHLRIHSGEKPYLCTYCGKSFSYHSSLKCHIRTHSGEKPYKCSQCNKCFSKNSYLRSHMVTHLKEKSYQCSLCDKAFTRSRALKEHEKNHTGVREKPYTCCQCGNVFIRSDHLRNHMLTHTGEKSYLCTYCGKTFAQHIKKPLP